MQKRKGNRWRWKYDVQSFRFLIISFKKYIEKNINVVKKYTSTAVSVVENSSKKIKPCSIKIFLFFSFETFYIFKTSTCFTCRFMFVKFRFVFWYSTFRAGTQNGFFWKSQFPGFCNVYLLFPDIFSVSLHRDKVLSLECRYDSLNIRAFQVKGKWYLPCVRSRMLFDMRKNKSFCRFHAVTTLIRKPFALSWLGLDESVLLLLRIVLQCLHLKIAFFAYL